MTPLPTLLALASTALASYHAAPAPDTLTVSYPAGAVALGTNISLGTDAPGGGDWNIPALAWNTSLALTYPNGTQVAFGSAAWSGGCAPKVSKRAEGAGGEQAAYQFILDTGRVGQTGLWVFDVWWGRGANMTQVRRVLEPNVRHHSRRAASERDRLRRIEADVPVVDVQRELQRRERDGRCADAGVDRDDVLARARADGQCACVERRGVDEDSVGGNFWVGRSDCVAVALSRGRHTSPYKDVSAFHVVMHA